MIQEFPQQIQHFRIIIKLISNVKPSLTISILKFFCQILDIFLALQIEILAQNMKVKRKERKKRNLLTRFEIYEFLDFLQNKTQEPLNFYLSSILILNFGTPHSFTGYFVSLFIYIRGFAPLHWLKWAVRCCPLSALFGPFKFSCGWPTCHPQLISFFLHYQSHILNSNNFF